jgi:hypothetical protein
MCLMTKQEPILVIIPNNGDRRRTGYNTLKASYPRYETLFVTHLGMFRFRVTNQ